jgi:hypothetical protein
MTFAKFNGLLALGAWGSVSIIRITSSVVSEQDRQLVAGCVHADQQSQAAAQQRRNSEKGNSDSSPVSPHAYSIAETVCRRNVTSGKKTTACEDCHKLESAVCRE